MDDINTIAIYMDKILSHKKVRFFKYFNVPKNHATFFLTTTFISLSIEFLTHFTFIPSLIALSLLYYHKYALYKVIDLSLDCLIHEETWNSGDWSEIAANFPDDPLYVTDSDRDSIVDDMIHGCIYSSKKQTFFQFIASKNKLHVYTFLIYSLFLLLAFFLSNL